MNACVFTGSFDPFTLGHLDIVRKALNVFDKVYIAVLENEAKSCMFNEQQRVEIAKAAVSDIENTEVVSSLKTAVELAKELKAKAL